VGEQFYLVRGQPATYLKTAESGNQRNLAFCGRCGTHLYAAPTSGTISFYSVRVGVLSERAQIRPGAQLWCQSELSWLPEIPKLHRVEKQ
jgi:hypothetical protein